MPVINKKKRALAMPIVVGLILLLIAASGIGVAVGLRLQRDSKQTDPHDHESEIEAGTIAFWTCSMHPQIRQPDPGQCPICAMDLIPVESDDSDDAPLDMTQIRLSANALALADIRTARVERKIVEANVRMVGKIAYDESRVAHITAWVGGRIDRLFVDTTGMPVRKGDHMVQLYSPLLLTAQEEYLQALQSRQRLSGSASDVIRRTVETNVEASHDKLKLLGLTQGQIDNLRETGKASDQVTIYAPTGGIVVDKLVSEGAYVQTGTRIYTVADLSQVWLLLDAYESDLGKLRYGQEVVFDTEAFPGESITGKISFISPVLEQATRTVQVRVSVANPDGRLRPGMFAHAVVRARLGQGGVVGDPALKDKWVCPMHPEIIKDEPAPCDICGMPLTRIENLGYLNPGEEQVPAIVVPVTAVLQTGRRAVVYVQVPDQEGVFEGREIELGPRAEEYFIVQSGLAEGERVVERGAFKIDSAMQILAKRSMMNPEGGPSGMPHADHGANGETDAPPTRQSMETPDAFDKQLTALFEAYYALQQALSQDAPEAAGESIQGLKSAFADVDMALLDGKPHMAWMVHHNALKKSLDLLAEAGDIESMRSAFALLSDALTAAAREFGSGVDRPVLVYQCPMAFNNRGAIWLQDKAGTENPYFGSAMFTCGDQIEAIVEIDQNSTP